MAKKKKHEKITEELEEQAYEEEKASSETKKKGTDGETEMAERMKELETRCAEWKDKYLRSMAEFENFRRRSSQEKTDWIKLSTQRLALEVCDVADNFERAIMQIDEDKMDDSFVKGVLMIEQQLRNVLAKEGVRKIEALGKEFDPSLHEALAHIPSEFEENIVAAVIQNGYMMHDKVLRPVRVAVSSGKIEETKDPETEDGPSRRKDPNEIENKSTMEEKWEK
ncbi:MAG: nucleotide exchange factor GrpE [Candidatus Syntrophosphaera sp.]